MKTNEEPKKDKSIQIPAEYKNCVGKSVVFGDGWADVVFKKSGNTLHFDSSQYSMSELSDFNDAETTLDVTGTEHAIINELRKMKDFSEDRAIVKLYENGKDELLDKLSSNAIDDWYKAEIKSASSSVDAAARFVYRLGNVAFDQNLTPLEEQDGVQYVIISSESGSPQTYYSRLKRENDYKVWYKAVDPIGWFGRRKDETEQND